MSRNFKEFAEKYLELTPTPVQESFMNYIVSLSKPNVKVVDVYNREKRRIANEFTCNKLTEMLPGESFVLVTPLGIYTFKLRSIQQIAIAGIDPTTVIIDEGGEL